MPSANFKKSHIDAEHSVSPNSKAAVKQMRRGRSSNKSNDLIDDLEVNYKRLLKGASEPRYLLNEGQESSSTKETGKQSAQKGSYPKQSTSRRGRKPRKHNVEGSQETKPVRKRGRPPKSEQRAFTRRRGPGRPKKGEELSSQYADYLGPTIPPPHVARNTHASKMAGYCELVPVRRHRHRNQNQMNTQKNSKPVQRKRSREPLPEKNLVKRNKGPDIVVDLTSTLSNEMTREYKDDMEIITKKSRLVEIREEFPAKNA